MVRIFRVETENREGKPYDHYHVSAETAEKAMVIMKKELKRYPTGHERIVGIRLVASATL